MHRSARRPRPVNIDDGAVHVPAHIVPISSRLSPEGKAYLIEQLRASARYMQPTSATSTSVACLRSTTHRRQSFPQPTPSAC
jgi:hypothetical protein